MRILSLMLLFCFLGTPALLAKPYKVGLTLGLSGKYQQMAIMQKRGLQLWEKQVNERGGLLGKPVEIVVLDDQSQPDKAKELYQQLIEDDKVDLLFGPYSSGLTEAVADIAEQHGYPLLASGASADTIWRKGRSQVFGIYSPASRYTLGFLEMLVMQELNRLALVTADDAFSMSLAQGARKWAQLLGQELVLDVTVPKGENDFVPLVKQARDSGAEVLLMCGHFEEAVDMRRAMQEVDWTPAAYYASVGPVLKAYRDLLGPAADQTFSSTQWQYHEDLAFPGAQDFYTSFLETYGEEPSYQAATAYAAGQMLEKAVRRAKSLDRSKLSSVFSSIDTLTILGRYGVDASGMQIRHQAMIIQWQQGRKEIVWPEDLRSAMPVFSR